jgi:integrase
VHADRRACGRGPSARFEQFNLDYAIWSKPASTTKQRKIHRVPISQDVAAIVRLRLEAVPRGNPWLFPGDAVGQPVREIRRFWLKVQRTPIFPKSAFMICATPSLRSWSAAARHWK